jgi:hypothetical protein
MKFVDQVMEQLCPDVIRSRGNNPVNLRTPGSRNIGGGGGGL